MARTVKPGLEYFPFDINFFQDLRIRKLIKRQSGKAVTVYALLLCIIYKDGYYIRWDNELPFVCSELTGFDEVYIHEVLNTCLALGLFDKELFVTEHVLTSKGIQQRYRSVQRLSKRMNRIDEYSLLTPTEPKDTAKTQDEPQATTQPQQQPTQNPEPQQPQQPLTQQPAQRSPYEETLHEILDNKIALEAFCKNEHTTPQEFETLARQTLDEWQITKPPHFTDADTRQHLVSAVRIKIKHCKNSEDGTTNKPRSRRRGVPDDPDYGLII